jgi:hypothetical protein
MEIPKKPVDFDRIEHRLKTDPVTPMIVATAFMDFLKQSRIPTEIGLAAVIRIIGTAMAHQQTFGRPEDRERIIAMIDWHAAHIRAEMERMLREADKPETAH